MTPATPPAPMPLHQTSGGASSPALSPLEPTYSLVNPPPGPALLCCPGPCHRVLQLATDRTSSLVLMTSGPVLLTASGGGDWEENIFPTPTPTHSRGVAGLALPCSLPWGWVTCTLTIKVSSGVLSRQDAGPLSQVLELVRSKVSSLELMTGGGGITSVPVPPPWQMGKVNSYTYRPPSWLIHSSSTRVSSTVLPGPGTGLALLSAASS